MELIFFILLAVYVFLSIKTIKLQNHRIKKLEGFVDDYLGGKNEHLQKRDNESISRVAQTDQG